jgi:hypothetical protein
MGDSSELAQTAVPEPILLGKPVSTLFANTPFTEQVRVDFDPSLWRTVSGNHSAAVRSKDWGCKAML